MSPTAADGAEDVVRRIVARTVYRPVRQGDVVAEAVARLGQAIGMGLLRPGDRLPSESRLAADLGISIVSLRSALTMLRGAGVLATSRGRAGGTVVTGVALDHPAGDALPGEAELRDLVDHRAVVESGAAALAAERASPAHLAQLVELAGQMRAITVFPAWSEHDTLLHLVIADATGSARITAEVGRLRAEVFRISQLVPVPAQAAALADREHDELIDAIVARAPDRARAVMVRHVESTLALWLGLGRVPAVSG
jgi:DNA-binding FadR family transcriptional regulator